MSYLPKPILRGHMKKKGLMAIFGAVTFATINCCLYYALSIYPKHIRTIEFEQDYDPVAHSTQLIKWGYFQTIRPEDLRKIPSDLFD